MTKLTDKNKLEKIQRDTKDIEDAKRKSNGGKPVPPAKKP